MKILIISLLIITIFISCKDFLPSNVLRKEKMEAVLWDYLKNDIYSFEYLKDSLHDDTILNINLQKKIFAKHHVTAVEFNTSYNYYTSNPKLFKEMLDSVVVREKRIDSAALNKKVVPAKGI